MLTCWDAELLLQDYLDGYLLPSQRDVLEEHVRSCESCRRLLGDLRRLDDELEGLPDVEAPEDLSGRILGSLPDEKPPGTPLRWRTVALAGTLVSAAVVLAIGILFNGRSMMQPQDSIRVVEIVFFAPAAESVDVVGDFNQWDSGLDRMSRFGDEGLWRARLELPPGIYQYGFFIDGRQWSKDPRAESFLADGFGGENSVLFVEG
jgi:hypothetical protein